MNDLKIEVPKGFIKSLNDFNQDMKTIFSEYYIYPDGRVISESKNNKYDIGKHFCITDYKFLEEYKDYIIHFNSDIIYRTIKDNKKDIKYICVENGIIKFIGDKLDIDIGTVIHMNGIKSLTILDPIYNMSTDIGFNVKNVDFEFSTDDVIDMVENKYKNISYESYRCRITREVIPGLKKSHSIAFTFNDMDDDNLFCMNIIAKRATLTSIHSYTCIRM